LLPSAAWPEIGRSAADKNDAGRQANIDLLSVGDDGRCGWARILLQAVQDISPVCQ
jgi:hypothetical protein